MIEYLLDTNTVIALVGKKSDAVLARLDRVKPGAIGTSSIVAHELYFGAYKSQKIAHNLETLRLLFADLVILDFDQGDARAAGEIRADLSLKGTPIGPFGAILVTNNAGEFRRVEELRLEDWTETPK